MKRLFTICIVIVLCMLAACTPVDEAAETPASTVKDEKETALLYAGELVNLYRARAEDSWGVIIEEFTWANKIITEIKTEADEYYTEALFYIRYLDANGQPCVFCLEHPASDNPLFFPFSDEEGVALTKDSQRRFEDAMLIGFLYADFQGNYAKEHPDDWEPFCQRNILDALYYNYQDTLPPYLNGEPDEEFPECSVVTQEELNGFFRCTVDRPNLVPDRFFEDEEVPELLPGQVPMWPTDYHVWPTVRKAVCVADGEYLLYGNVCEGEGVGSGVICRVIAVDGYLGWRVVNTELVDCTFDIEKTTAQFVPTPEN